MSTPQKYHDLLLSIISSSSRQIRSIDANVMNAKPLPHKWSKKELLGHLIDSAYNNYQRFIRAADQSNLVFPGYGQDAWVVKNDYQSRDLDDVIQLWELSNRHLAFVIKGLPKDLLDKKTTQHNFHQIGMNPVEEGTESSLGYFVWDYLFHLEYHLAQIISNYQKQNSSTPI